MWGEHDEAVTPTGIEEKGSMMIIKKSVAAASLIGATLIGGAVGVTMLGTASAASTTTPAAPNTSAGTTPAAGHPNEDATHEAGESAAREAAENNGTATYGPRNGSAPAAGTPRGTGG